LVAKTIKSKNINQKIAVLAGLKLPGITDFPLQKKNLNFKSNSIFKK